MRFVETSGFTAAVTSLLSDEEYRQLQITLLIRPAQGVLIRGSGGIRKLRWGARGRGKRGGVRVLYYWHPADASLYMLLIFAKSDRDDVTPSQLRALRRLMQEELG